METIFLIDDNSTYARNAAEFALQIARKAQAEIMIGTFKSPVEQSIAHFAGASSGFSGMADEEPSNSEYISEYLKALNAESNDYDCGIEEVDISSMSADNLARFINDSKAAMVIKTTHDGNHTAQTLIPVDMQAVLNRLIVPVCLVPAGWKPQLLKSMAYLTDLRYCRIDILNHLFKLTNTSDTEVYIAHIAVAGNADLSPEYATGLFSSLTVNPAFRERLFLHHIKQDDSINVADVLLNSMMTDTLVLTNHSAHFRQLIGDNLTVRNRDIIRVPLLLYPA
jgi:hypothetical protein